MQRTRLQQIAALSACAALGLAVDSLQAARRPHYGGDLRVEMRASLADLDAGDDALAMAARAEISPLVFETLVRIDDHGQPQPWLASSWTHDSGNKRWIFSARPNVTFHDGSRWSPPGGAFEISDSRTIEEILRDLARPSNAIVQRAPDGSKIGTGPFRIPQWNAGKSARLVAHEAYWGGRPFLDSITITMGRSLAEQATDFQLGKADVIEISPRDLRTPRQAGFTFATPLMETLALRFEPGRVPDRVREAVALSIDRAAIRDVLLQKQGEASGAILPKWLTGYSFLFSSARNIARGRELTAAGAGGAQTVGFAYDRQDPVIRPIAERIAVNASEAGVTLRSTPNNSEVPGVRLVRLPITSADPSSALSDLAALLKISANPSTPYEFEKALLGNFDLVPIVQLSRAWLLASRVHAWGNWADTWIDSAGQL